MDRDPDTLGEDPLDDQDTSDPHKSDPERFRERISSRSPEAVADAVNALLDNPVLNQALKAAFGARDLATDASNQALRNLNIATANDLDRLSRRLRSVSDRIEELEDTIDRLEHELSRARKGEANVSREQSPLAYEQERLGLSE